MTKKTESQVLNLVLKHKIELSGIDVYLKKDGEDFEKYWADYEKQLNKYLRKEKKWKDWVCKKTEFGELW